MSFPSRVFNKFLNENILKVCNNILVYSRSTFDIYNLFLHMILKSKTEEYDSLSNIGIAPNPKRLSKKYFSLD